MPQCKRIENLKYLHVRERVHPRVSVDTHILLLRWEAAFTLRDNFIHKAATHKEGVVRLDAFILDELQQDFQACDAGISELAYK